ncbi:histidine kinase [Actinomyces massiliensis]|jgi:two-component system sensor kinase|uniref:histidine kinase n=1 Tax=Actinomyces massiliensis F0489 TaxID=1125718 RepID=J0MUJ1_9ACTO|nr:ATP-binding protein [Actinomyces massiliensis]EJF37989.1 GHKL domain protein [Actinomyces massiliensis F0489]WLD72319.1 histidine kinase [Actinomyces massiliensis]
MSGAVGLICDVRLGILLTCEFALMTTGTSALSIISLFVAMGMSWIPLRVIRRAPTVLNRGWLFPCTDLVVTSTLVFALSNAFNGAEDLVLAYVLTSALLVGTVTNAAWAAIWTTGVLTVLVTTRLSHMPLSPAVSLISTLGIGAGVLLGNRLFIQLQEVGRLTAEAAAARAEERALTERLAIARDLHDSLAKSVHGIRMLAETLDDSLRSERHKDAALSRTLFESADEASREARLVLDGLRISGEDDVAGALCEEVARWSARTGIAAACLESEPSQSMPCSPETMWQLQRVLGEALTNIEKHARASAVSLSVGVEEHRLRIEISDDGVGLMDAESTETISPEGHYGLIGMRERAEALGAELSIESQPEPGVGLRTRLLVPLTSLTAPQEVRT